MLITDGTQWGEVVTNNWTASYSPRTIFEEGRALFYNEVISTIKSIASDVDYGLLPLPKYDEAQEKYMSTVQYDNSGCIAVPITLNEEKMEMTSILLEALCEDSHTSTLPTFIDVVMQSKKAPDEHSAQTLQLIFDANNIVYDMYAAYNIDNINVVVSQELFQNHGETYVSTMEAHRDTILEKYNAIVEAFGNMQ